MQTNASLSPAETFGHYNSGYVWSISSAGALGGRNWPDISAIV